MGASPTTVRSWLIAARVITEQPSVAPDQLRRLYVDQQLRLREVAAVLGLPVARVRTSLLAAGIPIRDKRLRRPTPAQAAVTDEVLHQLYVQQRLPIKQVAQQLGVSVWYLSKRVGQAGLRKRPGTHTPHLPHDPADLTQRAIVGYQQGLNIHDVANRLGISASTVIQLLHDAGVPIRPGGLPHNTDGRPPYVLIDDLYADPDVRAVLSRHHVVVPPPGHWRKAGPHESYAPLPLSGQLLRELYVDVGLACSHIALLCGVGRTYVYDGLAQHGITPRQPGAASPWFARTHAQSSARNTSRSTRRRSAAQAASPSR